MQGNLPKFCIKVSPNESAARTICGPAFSHKGPTNWTAIDLTTILLVPASNNHGSYELLILVVHLQQPMTDGTVKVMQASHVVLDLSLLGPCYLFDQGCHCLD